MSIHISVIHQLPICNNAKFFIPSEKLRCLANSLFVTHTNAKCHRSAHLNQSSTTYISITEAHNSKELQCSLGHIMPLKCSTISSTYLMASIIVASKMVFYLYEFVLCRVKNLHCSTQNGQGRYRVSFGDKLFPNLHASLTILYATK